MHEKELIRNLSLSLSTRKWCVSYNKNRHKLNLPLINGQTRLEANLQILNYCQIYIFNFYSFQKFDMFGKQITRFVHTSQRSCCKYKSEILAANTRDAELEINFSRAKVMNCAFFQSWHEYIINIKYVKLNPIHSIRAKTQPWPLTYTMVFINLSVFQDTNFCAKVKFFNGQPPRA